MRRLIILPNQWPNSRSNWHSRSKSTRNSYQIWRIKWVYSRLLWTVNRLPRNTCSKRSILMGMSTSTMLLACQVVQKQIADQSTWFIGKSITNSQTGGMGAKLLFLTLTLRHLSLLRQLEQQQVPKSTFNLPWKSKMGLQVVQTNHKETSLNHKQISSRMHRALMELLLNQSMALLTSSVHQ